MSAVHPRVGGEQTLSAKRMALTSGSSPRGRGTVQGARIDQRVHRFIPAWAGNSSSPWPARCSASVHPRVGGEQTSCHSRDASPHGSSPRGRGTGSGSSLQVRPSRFIPAWAGNRCERDVRRGRWSVHPRVGGEQAESSVRITAQTGSSPRGRGTDALSAPHTQRDRFIPAWAGNSLRPRNCA